MLFFTALIFAGNFGVSFAAEGELHSNFNESAASSVLMCSNSNLLGVSSPYHASEPAELDDPILALSVVEDTYSIEGQPFVQDIELSSDFNVGYDGEYPHYAESQLEMAKYSGESCLDPQYKLARYAEAAKYGNPEALYRWALMIRLGKDGVYDEACAAVDFSDVYQPGVTSDSEADLQRSAVAFAIAADMGYSPALVPLAIILSSSVERSHLQFQGQGSIMDMPLPPRFLNAQIVSCIGSYLASPCDEAQTTEIAQLNVLHQAFSMENLWNMSAALELALYPAAIPDYILKLSDASNYLTAASEPDALPAVEATDLSLCARKRAEVLTLGFLHMAAKHSRLPPRYVYNHTLNGQFSPK